MHRKCPDVKDIQFCQWPKMPYLFYWNLSHCITEETSWWHSNVQLWKKRNTLSLLVFGFSYYICMLHGTGLPFLIFYRIIGKFRLEGTFGFHLVTLLKASLITSDCSDHFPCQNWFPTLQLHEEHGSIFCVSSDQVSVGSNKVSPEPCLLKADRPR